jgi:hypothetical protein
VLVTVVTVPVNDPKAKLFVAESLCRWGLSGMHARTREAIKAELRADPGSTDRVIAARVSGRFGRRVHHATVGKCRRQLVKSGEIDQLSTRRGKDGGSYRHKPKPGK